MTEWAWGISRIIDGLYMTASMNNIDVNHTGVTGCSFQGTMAFYAGAFGEAYCPRHSRRIGRGRGSRVAL